MNPLPRYKIDRYHSVHTCDFKMLTKGLGCFTSLIMTFSTVVAIDQSQPYCIVNRARAIP